MSHRKTLAERFSEAMRPVKHIKEAIQHNNEILETLSETISAQRSDYTALQQMVEKMAQRLALIEAGAGHMTENADWMKTIVDNQSDTMMLIHNFGWLLENSEEFWADALARVQPDVFNAAVDALREERRAVLGL